MQSRFCQKISRLETVHTPMRRFLHIKTVPKLYGSNADILKHIAGIPTHELLTKLGFVNHPKAGLVNWLPIGLSVNRKLSNLVRSRMDEHGFEEVSLSSLTDDALWKVSGRYDKSEEIFKVAGETLLLAPTAEEEIASLVKKSINSYKNLPIRYYQINSKFRNEKRPRGGLLRGKEFIMKDAYTFDIDNAEAWVSYGKATDAYHRIFEDLKVPFVRAEADSGDIGGSSSHEYHYLHNSGEDTVFICNSCGDTSNVEVAKECTGSATSETSSANYSNDEGSVVRLNYPAGRIVEPKFLKGIVDGDLHKVEKVDESKNILEIFDTRLQNQGLSKSMVLTEDGDVCGICHGGTLQSTKAIEVAHTFFLGDKYSKPLECSVEVPGNNGLVKTDIIMGCYGIGISRIIASIGDIKRDIKGFIWPRCIAPWDTTVIEAVSGEFTQAYEELKDIDYKLDDRAKIGMGKKITQSNMIGIPLVVILGRSFPIVEIEIRGVIGKGENSESWRKLYETKDFEWSVEGNKHFVHVDGLKRVINALLEDM